MIELIKNTKIDFIGKRYIAFALSIALMGLGFYAIWAIWAGKANMGLDFAGGVSMQVKFTQKVTVEKIREVMDKGQFRNVSIQQIGADADNEFLLRLKKLEKGTTEATEAKVLETLRKEANDPGMIETAITTVEPAVSAQLKEKAAYAIAWSLVGILVYIWIRFKFKFAVAATIATFHDVLAVLGIMTVMGREIDLLTITALLTLAGYSLTDTVVVFDRIRENMRYILKSNYKDIINLSINEVLSRTIVTSTTVMLVVVALFVLGGEILNNFSLAMILGVVVGTYSSIFVASPIIYEWETLEKPKKQQ